MTGSTKDTKSTPCASHILPAFTALLKGTDTHLSTQFPMQQIDDTWTAVSITSDMVAKTWLQEYILCFLDSRMWVGRLLMLRRTHHRAEAGPSRPTAFTIIPNSYKIFVPGPRKVLLILLDENGIAINTTTPIQRPNDEQLLRVPYTEANYYHHISEQMAGLLDDYAMSAIRMCQALERIETNLCVDMAFQLDFTIAAELFASMPESSFLEVA